MLKFQNQAPKKSRKTKKVGFNSNTGYFGSPLEMLSQSDLQEMFGSENDATDASLAMIQDVEEWESYMADQEMPEYNDEDPYW
jgi:hypothetical protein